MPIDPRELALANFRARADRLRAALDEALRELSRDEALELLSTCAKGHLSDLDEKSIELVTRLALYCFLDLMDIQARQDQPCPPAPQSKSRRRPTAAALGPRGEIEVSRAENGAVVVASKTGGGRIALRPMQLDHLVAWWGQE